jgi:hypothetical protein
MRRPTRARRASSPLRRAAALLPAALLGERPGLLQGMAVVEHRLPHLVQARSG